MSRFNIKSYVAARMQFYASVIPDMQVNNLSSLTCVEQLLNNDSHLTPEHGVEQLDDKNETCTEHQQGQSKQDQSHSQVWQIR